MNDEQRHDLTATAKQLLDQASDSLDGATLSRLQRARNRALARRNRQPAWFRRPLPLAGAAGSAFSAAVLAFLLVLHPAEQESIEHNLLADLGIVTSEEPIEFFEEIDFYEWLSAVDEQENRLSGLPDGLSAGHGRPGLGQRQDSASGGRKTGDGHAGISRLI